jgi:hypothetical protein
LSVIGFSFPTERSSAAVILRFLKQGGESANDIGFLQPAIGRLAQVLVEIEQFSGRGAFLGDHIARFAEAV